ATVVAVRLEAPGRAGPGQPPFGQRLVAVGLPEQLVQRRGTMLRYRRVQVATLQICRYRFVLLGGEQRVLDRRLGGERAEQLHERVDADLGTGLPDRDRRPAV